MTHTSKPSRSAPSRRAAGELAVATALVFTTTAATAEPPSPAAGQQASELQEVVVTAQKRAQDIQSVPMSISALTGTALEAIGAGDFQAVAHAVPGLSFANGVPGQATVSLRGVSASAGDATVAFYLDEVPLPSGRAGAGTSDTNSLGAPDPRVFDFERIEVLRGPQGTLYGASSMGGTIRFVTNSPRLNVWEGSLAAELGSTDSAGGANYRATAVVNVPLVQDRVALRAGLMHGRLAGFVDRFTLGGAPAETNSDWSDFTVARLSARVQADDTLSITPLLLYQRNHLNDVPVFASSLTNYGKFANFAEPQTDTLKLGALTMRKDFGPVELTSVSSYSQREIDYHNDYGNIIYGIFEGILAGIDPQLGALALPYRTDVLIPNENRTTQTQVAEEIRIASTSRDASLQWLFGVYFARTQSRYIQPIVAPGFDAVGDSVLTPVFGFNPLASIDDVPFYGDSRLTTKEYAAFGDITYRLGSHWSVASGVRWFRDQRDVERYSGGLFDAGPGIYVTQPPAASSERGFDPRFSINYQATPENLLYVSAAKGFRPGGSNTIIPNNPQCAADIAAYRQQTGRDVRDDYGPDSVWNYELGSKNTLGDGRVIANVTVFYLEWSGIQQRLNLDDYAGAGCGFGFTDNVGRAVSKGGEMELQARLATRWTAGLAASYVDAQVTSGTNDGERVLNVPQTSFNASLNYRAPLGRDLYGLLRLDESFTGNSTRNFLAASGNHVARRYSLTNVRVGVQKDSWEVALFGTNVFNAHPLLDDTVGPLTLEAAALAGQAAYNIRTTVRPRTFGIVATVKF